MHTLIVRNHMKRLLLSMFISIIFFSPSYSQPSSRPVYVIVHGAWGGSWAFKKVDSLLTAKGAVVYRPSLTGQGERVHLASRDIGLRTHINDVVNMILFEDLHDVILLGHSYGGMVVTGAADSVAERIGKLIYLDAFVPENGESLLGIQGPRGEWFKQMLADGFAVPPWVPAGKLPPKDVPHPFKTLTDTLILKNDLRKKIPSAYILTVEKGTDAANDDFAGQGERAKKKGWPVLQLEADHNPQWSAPEALVNMLERAAREIR